MTPPSSDDGGGSILLAEEYYQAEDARFVDALRRVSSPPQLAGFVDRWKRDPRPWARGQIFAYLAQPLDCIGHNVVVRRLFKHAEAGHDHELIAALLVVFDGLVRRERRRRWRYDRRSGESWEEEYLAAPSNSLPLEKTKTVSHPRRPGKTITLPARIPREGRLFSYRTRYYLRRRAWRYFRKLGFQHPEQYPGAIARALAAYQDDDLAEGQHLLESWGLMQACFRASAVLQFGARQIRVRAGRALNELVPAPRFAGLWRQPSAMAVLVGLVGSARSRLVRLWAIEWLKREHGPRLAEVPLEAIVRLLRQPEEEVQRFAAELLAACNETASLSAEAWLGLVGAAGGAALEWICQAMRARIAPERLTAGDCLKLACAEPAPVARLGLEYLQARAWPTAAQRAALAALAGAKCFAMAGELASWSLTIVGTAEGYDREAVVRLFDSLQEPARQAAWQWLDRPESPGHDDPVLWSRMMETPYDDLRLALVDRMERRASMAGVGADDLAPLWCAVLVGVHRGGRQKAKAARQIARAIQREPARADSLLPVLAAAVRSVRPAEARAGLASVVAAVEARPEIAPHVERLFPELRLGVGDAGEVER